MSTIIKIRLNLTTLISKAMKFKPYSGDTEDVKSFRKKVLNPWALKLFYLLRLPTLAWWGVRVISLSDTYCTVRIKYGYRTKNPFRSLYFGALAGAAELATGMLCLQSFQGRADISMLVTRMSSEFEKKGVGEVCFTCEEGAQIIRVIDLAIQTKEPQTLVVHSTGKDRQGDVVARFQFTWSFKLRST